MTTVGRGHTPKDTFFRKEQSGNPRGGPKRHERRVDVAYDYSGGGRADEALLVLGVASRILPTGVDEAESSREI